LKIVLLPAAGGLVVLTVVSAVVWFEIFDSDEDIQLEERYRVLAGHEDFTGKPFAYPEIITADRGEVPLIVKSDFPKELDSGVHLAVTGRFDKYGSFDVKSFALKSRTAAVTSQAASPITTLRPEAQEIFIRLTATDKKVGDIVLEANPRFQIDWLISSREFMVRIWQPPFSQGKEEARNWFLAKGFEPDDLCLINLYFFGAREAGDFQYADTFPGGCPVKPYPSYEDLIR